MRRANRAIIPPKKNENYFEKKFNRRKEWTQFKKGLFKIGQIHSGGADAVANIRDYFIAKPKKRGKSKFNLQKRHNKIMFPLWKMRSFRGLF